MHSQKTKIKVPKNVLKIVKESRAVSLDVGCGNYKRKGAIGMDIRPLPGVDIVHDINHYPWPIPSDVCNLITANHVLEHIPKNGTQPQIDSLAKLLISKGVLTQREVDESVGETQIFSYLMRFLDECWRVMKVGGQLAIVLPYANSIGFLQDPTHTSPITEADFFYFDPTNSSNLWTIYTPKPWHIEMSTYQINGNMEVILEKLPWKEEYNNIVYPENK